MHRLIHLFALSKLFEALKQITAITLKQRVKIAFLDHMSMKSWCTLNEIYQSEIIVELAGK